MTDPKEVIIRMLGDVFRENGFEPTLSDIRLTPSVADGTLVFAIGNVDHRAILLVSPSGFPKAVSGAQSKARAIRAHIGAKLGSTILVPYAEGTLNDRTYALLPLAKRLSDNRVLWAFQKYWLKRHLLAWLRRVNEQFNFQPDSSRIERIERGLTRLSLMHAVHSDLREVAQRGIDQMHAGGFRPRVAPSHNDLWRGNILLPYKHKTNTDPAYPFFIIDWGGSRIDGFPFFDLVRLSNSLRFTPTELRSEIMETCAVLECRTEDVRYYLAAALGDISLHLEQFPLGSFLQMARLCFTELQKAGI